MILEVAILNVVPGEASNFEQSFDQAQKLIQSIPGYISHELQRCLEVQNQYVLLVKWKSVEAHEVGFRQSQQYQAWKSLLHHYYKPFPAVYHYEPV